MSKSVNDLFSRIETHIHYGEWNEADELVQNLRHSSDITADDEIKLIIYRTHILIETKEYGSARSNVNQLINNVGDYPKSIQLQILQVAAKFSYSVGEYGMAEIYVNKFNEIYETISVVLKDKAEALNADIKNIHGLLLSSKNNTKEALKLFEDVTSMQKRLGRLLHQGIASFNAGKTALELEQANRAEVYLQEAYTIFKDLEYTKGQYQVTRSFVECYKLKGDPEGILSFQSISKDLKHKLEKDQIRKQNQKELQIAREKNEELRSRLVSLQSQVHNHDTATQVREEELEDLRAKSRDFEEVKEVYSNLKVNILQLEVKVQQQEKKIAHQQEIINDQNKVIDQLKSEIKYNKNELDTPTSASSGKLHELLASSKLLDNIYHKLREIGQVKLKLLAMQVCVSVEKCTKAIKQFEELDFVTVDNWQNNPQVALNSKYQN